MGEPEYSKFPQTVICEACLAKISVTVHFWDYGKNSKNRDMIRIAYQGDCHDCGTHYLDHRDYNLSPMKSNTSVVLKASYLEN